MQDKIRKMQDRTEGMKLYDTRNDKQCGTYKNIKKICRRTEEAKRERGRAG